jgi:arabinofuranosyltransferase
MATVDEKTELPRHGHNRALRITYAVLSVVAARWLLPLVFPYFSFELWVDRGLRACLGEEAGRYGGWIGAAYVVPYIILSLMVYFYPRIARRRIRTEAEGKEDQAGRTARRRSPLVGLLAAGIIVGLVLLAYHQRLLVDDAFISFRYARNWVDGMGLVFNPGERVEGYTNFLWVVLLAGGMTIGLAPTLVSQLLGLTFYAGTLWLTYRMARQVLHHVAWAIITVVLLGTNFTVLSFATSGLETSLQTFLLVAGVAVVIHTHARGAWLRRDALLLSLLLSAGILTRMDFAIFAAILVPAAILSIFATNRESDPQRKKRLWSRLCLLLLPAVVLVGIWLIWRGYYYGSILPNTFFVKIHGTNVAQRGLHYLTAFSRSYQFALPVLIAAIGLIQLVRERHILLAIALIVPAWCAYTVAVGGDFIEFRFLAPVLPLFMLCLVWTMARFTVSRRLFLHVFVMLWVLHGSLHHVETYAWSLNRPEPVPHLRRQVEDSGWVEAGLALRALFRDKNVIIATTAAGVVPYYSGLTTIDMHGLTDAYVARHGILQDPRPGHGRMASLEYLKERGVNFVLGYPWVLSSAGLDEQPPVRLAHFARVRRAVDEATLVAIPINEDRILLAWYLTPHPAIDQMIAAEGWRTFTVDPRDDLADPMSEHISDSSFEAHVHPNHSR